MAQREDWHKTIPWQYRDALVSLTTMPTYAVHDLLAMRPAERVLCLWASQSLPQLFRQSCERVGEAEESFPQLWVCRRQIYDQYLSNMLPSGRGRNSPVMRMTPRASAPLPSPCSMASASDAGELTRSSYLMRTGCIVFWGRVKRQSKVGFLRVIYRSPVVGLHFDRMVTF